MFWNTIAKGHELTAAVQTDPPGIRVIVDGHVLFIEAKDGEPVVHLPVSSTTPQP